MTIREAILAVLSRGPYSGYDIKKIIRDSPFLPWTGNNNQIYKTLVSLAKEGLVTKKTIHQEGAPSKIVYELNESGQAELKHWLLSEPEAPEFKNLFLARLAYADALSQEELVEIITGYEEEVKIKLLTQQEMIEKKGHLFAASSKENILAEMLGENILSFYTKELSWIKKLKLKLFKEEPIKQEDNKEERSRGYRLIESNRGKYLEIASLNRLVCNEKDALEIVALCNEFSTRNVIIYAQALAPGFFQLKTGVAVKVLQKFINYRIKTAIIVAKQSVKDGSFLKMATEAGKGYQFRIFDERERAEKWLIESGG